MKKLLILIVSAAVFLHFYPQPELTQWYNEQKESMLTSFNNATDTKVRLNAKKVFSDLELSFNRFSPEEIEYATQVTANRDSIIEFYKASCEAYKPDYNFQAANQKTVCKTISKYHKYF
ncbi:hypothetical protein [Pseudocolwellia agarivorans]|uniref:hypothetical protein n=1 Tax=Pseudocolwellia agarivorans TaxID=1911682 RepID=UPI000985F26C|nr:hypothetical protein [Pseudocolwellia agarivorans]